MEKMFDPTKNIGFGFLKDEILWGDIWKNPFPITSIQRSIILSDYFSVEPENLITNLGFIKQRKILKPLNSYFDLESKVEYQEDVFCGLYEFLLRYNRPFRDILIKVPKHPEQQIIEGFDPLSIYYRKPTHLCLNPENVGIEILLMDKKISDCLFGYIFNINPPANVLPLFSFHPRFFRGLRLHY